ncbi:MAG: gamma-glutamyl-gamma-aminobutyrate hydrolase family protein [Frankiaceae bacterium]|nr:gamma-glutamyl-gamma-aminobutyrate hydrolase family protein [Frankiaceae bacterium]MBV9872469.1 gamma-glutamyl-gamma-aminobutyrate hydrolase family protein [Frankiaceae bacterium]
MTGNLPPRIGLTTYREAAAFGVWDEPADLLPTTYADAIAAVGGVPMLLPPAAADPHLAAASALNGVHGLLLSGGADVDPTSYGDAERHPETGPPRRDRDDWEIALVRDALARDMPVLGVCRGMQVLSVALGGTLVQHLPDVVANESHRPVVGKHGRHDVALAGGTRLAGWLGDACDVATYHHQAVATLPVSTVAQGWADDGTVEAFEVCDKTWAIGVQWHPEVDSGTALFREFVKASKEFSAHPKTAARVDYGIGEPQ